MGPGFNAVCAVREEQNYKSDPPSHGREGRRKTARGRKERSEEKKEGLRYQMGLSLHRD